jgi:peptidyl-prolyl cis-trans isomerase B (cyclophilin B)
MHFKILTLGFVFLLFGSLAPQIFADSKVAIIETKFGNMTVEFFPNKAPKTVENFMNLTQSGFYNGAEFHRIVPGFVIQGGNDSKHKINAEFNDIKFKRGIVGMARANDPNSATAQFFIVQKDSMFLNGKYTAFGNLTTQESYKVLDKIASLKTVSQVPVNPNDARIISIKIIDKPNNSVSKLAVPDIGTNTSIVALGLVIVVGISITAVLAKKKNSNKIGLDLRP